MPVNHLSLRRWPGASLIIIVIVVPRTEHFVQSANYCTARGGFDRSLASPLPYGRSLHHLCHSRSPASSAVGHASRAIPIANPSAHRLSHTLSSLLPISYPICLPISPLLPLDAHIRRNTVATSFSRTTAHTRTATLDRKGEITHRPPTSQRQPLLNAAFMPWRPVPA